MPGFERVTGFNHPTDHDFLALEDIVYGFTRSLRDDDNDNESNSSSSSGSSSRSGSSSDSSISTIYGLGSGRGRHNRGSGNKSMSCPVCKADHTYMAPQTNTELSHNARVVYASFACPICLEDAAGPPMIVLQCGHAVCQDDFRLLGGKTMDPERDAEVRRAMNEESDQHRETRRRNDRYAARSSQFPFFLNGNNNNSSTSEQDTDPLAMAMMHAFASSLNETTTTSTGNTSNNNNSSHGTTNNNNTNNAESNSNNEARDLTAQEIFVQSMMRQWGGRAYPPPPPGPPPRTDPPPRIAAATTTPTTMEERLGGIIDFTDRPNNNNNNNTSRHDNDEGSYEDDSNFFFESESDDSMDGYSSLEECETSNDEDYEEEDEDEEEESDYEDPEEVLWRLSEYHPGNAVLSDPPNHAGFPKLGQWLLVPEVADSSKVNLMYYCEYEEENNLFVAKQFPRGTRVIPNGKHGVYVHAPPPPSASSDQQNNRLWNMYYVKNSKPPRNRFRGRRSRQEAAQILSTTVGDPIFRFKIPKSAQCVADGKGGIWALCPINALTPELREQIVDSSEENNDDSAAEGRTRHERRRSNWQKLRLVHYSRRRYTERDGIVVGDIFPPKSVLFMDQSGGVIIMKPNTTTSGEAMDCSSLWHVSHRGNYAQTLLYGGLPSQTKVIGDANGTSVFILSEGGRLQSILTRVMVQQQSDPENEGEMQITTSSFSYDLDLAVQDIQDIVDQIDGDPKHVFVHARRRREIWGMEGGTRNQIQWRLCRIVPGEGGTRSANIEELDVDCPRGCRIVSDREKGVWIWRKPTHHISPNDRCFVHCSGDGEEEWDSPCVFPPRTQLVALSGSSA